MSTLVTPVGTTSIHTLALYIPRAGAWRAQVILDSGETLPSVGAAATLSTAGLSLAGFVERASFDAPSKPQIIVSAGLGWKGSVTKAISFQSDAGVRLSTVLNAIAGAAKQKIELPADLTVGDYYEIVASRPGEPVAWVDVLADLTRGGYVAPWRVDPDGITRFGLRKATAVSTRATVLRRDASDGSTTFGLDDPAQFLPGNTIEGVEIGRIKIRETAGKLEADVWPAKGAAAPIADQVRRLVAAAFQDKIRTYVVSSVASDGRVTLEPPADAPHLPEMRNVEVWTLGGTKYEAVPGEEICVTFRDERKTRPIALGVRPSAGPFAGIARLGDTVTVMLPPATFSGTINGLPASGLVVWAPGNTLGTITTSSAKTKAGP